MGPAHRRADSRRSARKNSGYTPWHLLPAAAREAKRKRPSRTPAKKRRAPPAPARSPSPTQRPRPLPPVVALLGALAAAVLLLDAARRVAAARRRVGAAAAPAQRSPCNRICRRNPSFMDGTVCASVACSRTTRYAGGRAFNRANAMGFNLMRRSGVPRGRNTLA